jgi:hypothetical protein
MTKQVVATGVIVRGEEPGISGNRLTGSLGTPPKITHIKPGTIFLIENDKGPGNEYDKLKKMRVIQDYIPALGNPAKRIEQFFGVEDAEPKSDVIVAAEAAIEAKRLEDEAAAEAARVKAEAEARDRARAAAQNARAAELEEERRFKEQQQTATSSEGTTALGSTDTGIAAGTAQDPDADKKAKAAAARAAREQKAADKAAKDAADKAAKEAAEKAANETASDADDEDEPSVV